MSIDTDKTLKLCISKINGHSTQELRTLLNYHDGRDRLKERVNMPENIFGQVNMFCGCDFEQKDPWTRVLVSLFDKYGVPYMLYEGLEDPNYLKRSESLEQFRKTVGCAELGDFYIVNALDTDYSVVATATFDSRKRRGLVTISSEMEEYPRTVLTEQLGFKPKTIQCTNDLNKNRLPIVFGECYSYIETNYNSNKPLYDHYSSAIFLLHGKGTFGGGWVQKLKSKLEALGFYVEGASIGFVNHGQFLIPTYAFLGKKCLQVKKDFEGFCERSGDRKRYAIAHSLGSFLMGRALEDMPKCLEGGLIFCGSIANPEMEPVLSQATGDQSRIINDVGLADGWPALASGMLVPYGQVGFEGFNKGQIMDRYHQDVTHSGFFSDEFMEKYWIPFLSSGIKVDGSAKQMNNSLWRCVQSRIPLEAWHILAYLILIVISLMVICIMSIWLGGWLSIILALVFFPLTLCLFYWFL